MTTLDTHQFLANRMEDAVEKFQQRPQTASNRMDDFAQVLIDLFALYGIAGWTKEIYCEGYYTRKKCDLVLQDIQGNVLAIINLKATAKTFSNLNNRREELIGDFVNLHRANPKTVIGTFSIVATHNPVTGEKNTYSFDKWLRYIKQASNRISHMDPHDECEAASVYEYNPESLEMNPALGFDIFTFVKTMSEMIKARNT